MPTKKRKRVRQKKIDLREANNLREARLYVKNLRQENVGVPDLKSETGFGLPIRDPVKKAELIHLQAV